MWNLSFSTLAVTILVLDERVYQLPLASLAKKAAPIHYIEI